MKTEGGIGGLVEISSEWGRRMHRRVGALAWNREEKAEERMRL